MDTLVRQEPEAVPETIRVAGVKIRNRGAIKRMAAGSIQLEVGDRVMLEMDRDLTYGVVYVAPQPMPFVPQMRVMTAILRKATQDDESTIARHERVTKEAFALCKEKAAALGLKMKMVEVYCSFRKREITFVYTAEERVDFRQLIKELARHFSARVEMRHIGTRQEAQILGGVDTCGLVVCCAAFLTDLRPVNFKKMRAQDVALGDSRLIGVCGRLKCCLMFETDEFLAARGDLPPGAPLIQPTRPSGLTQQGRGN